ncbi:MAG: D-glycero-beta-D-manno-heptose-7-phosphate kinase [Fidelibacterota bacterium]
MNPARYKELEKGFGSKTVLVIGDLILDNYLWGHAGRISPEAPVPVVKIESTGSNPGGAANVAYNLRSLGARVLVTGAVGDDPDGARLKSILNDLGIDVQGVLVDPAKPTTVKTRIIAQGQQVVRTDWEDVSPSGEDVLKRLKEEVKSVLGSCDAVIFQDYNKGLLVPAFVDRVKEICQKEVIPMYADPKYENFFSYSGMTLVKPNQQEVSRATGLDFSVEDTVVESGQALREKLDCEILLITRSEKGMSLFDGSGHHRIPTRARSVHDVSGAGDTVIASFCLAHISGASPQEAATVANYAAGRVCEEVGVVPITRDNLHEIIIDHNT